MLCATLRMIMPSLISFLLYVCFVAVWLGLTDINDVLLGSTEEWLVASSFPMLCVY